MLKVVERVLASSRRVIELYVIYSDAQSFGNFKVSLKHKRESFDIDIRRQKECSHAKALPRLYMLQQRGKSQFRSLPAHYNMDFEITLAQGERLTWIWKAGSKKYSSY